MSKSQSPFSNKQDNLTSLLANLKNSESLPIAPLDAFAKKELEVNEVKSKICEAINKTIGIVDKMSEDAEEKDVNYIIPNYRNSANGQVK